MNDKNAEKSRDILAADTGDKDSDGNSVSDENGGGSGKPEVMLAQDALKNLPPEARKVVEFGMSMHRFGPMPNPLTEKLNESHIDKILEFSAKADERSFQDTAQSRWFTLVYVLIFAALFVFLTIFLVGQDKELYKEAVKLFAAFLGGFGGGFGVKTYIDRDK
jgi:predicted PurR-regulated permease PerM